MSTTNDLFQLIIRTANNKYADLEIQISSIQTVFDLKQQIQLNHPTKPIPRDQRLIFAGKLLIDANQLQDVFSKSASTSFMIHLVLDSDKNATTTKSPSPEKVQPPPINREQTSTNTQPPTISNHSPAYEQYLSQLNQYQQQLQQFLINPTGFSSIENQVYLQYCHTHYQMYQNLHAYQRTVASSMSINASPTTQTNMNTNVSEPTSPPPPAAAAAAAPNNNNNNNELEPENDLLGILNMIVELFVLCSIIYFYSTFSRFLLVFLFFALLYLHCRGYLTIQRRRRAQPNQAPVAPEQVAGNNNEAAGGTDEEAENEANENQQQQQTPAPPINPFGDSQISTARVFVTAVSTFFSSLIPERPQRT